MPLLKYDGSVAAETASPTNNLYGANGAETLNGTAGADSLWGDQSGVGHVMTGGAGDDTYYVRSVDDQVIEQPGGGTDKVVAYANVSLTNYANIENLEVDGDKVYGAGNAGDNVIVAGGGTVQLYGGGGQDVLVGGSGQDTFIVKASDGNDAIYGFKTSEDVVRLSAGFSDFSQLQSHMSQVGADVKIDFGSGNGLILRNVQVGQLTAANFQLQVDPSKLGAMTFHDEFSGPVSIWNPTYNPTGTWRPDYGYQGTDGVGSYTLTGNGELQVYTSPYFRGAAGDHASPFTSNSDGTLTISAAPASAGDLFGYGYTSGMISTKESFAQTYGYFEMRAELPHGAGGWPAFWLVPADGSWPPELDVMETLTGDAHNDYTTEHSQATGVHVANGVASYIPDTTDGFHTYGVLWTKTDLEWFVDGTEVFHTATPADMNKPMYMIANLALGGWSGTIDPASMPEQMKIDYIRAYALGDGSTTVQGFDANQASGSYVAPTDNTDTASGVAASPPPAPASPPPTSAPPASPPPVSPPPAGFTGTDATDTLTGSVAGGETMTGGAGHDVFAFKTVPWVGDHITDFTVGEDRLDFSALFASSHYAGTDPVADGFVRLAGDSTGTWVIYDTDGTGSADQWGTSVVHLDGVSAAGLTSAELFGTPGAAASPPPVSTPPASPPPVSGAGAVGAGGVTDTPSLALYGKAGGDTLMGGANADTITGSSGQNYLRGNDGNDSIVGGSGFNDINGNKGDDTIAGHSTVGDWLVGGQGNDSISSSGDHNILYGNLGDDTLVGSGSGEILRGGQGDDSIVAGSGTEWISGDRGADTIQAGSGADTFHSFAGAGIDEVIGFKAGVDHVQLDPGTSYTVSQLGADVVIAMGGTDELILKNVALSSLGSGWIFT